MFADVTTRTRRFKDGIYKQVARLGKDVGRLLLLLRRLAESRLAEIERATRAFFDASNTLEGVPDWRARRWRVETAAARTPARQRTRAAR
jgi:hypothetical protein